MATVEKHTTGDWMCIYIRRQVKDGRVPAGGFGTLLVAVGCLVTRLISTPPIILALIVDGFFIGSFLCQEAGTVGLDPHREIWVKPFYFLNFVH